MNGPKKYSPHCSNAASNMFAINEHIYNEGIGWTIKVGTHNSNFL